MERIKINQTRKGDSKTYGILFEAPADPQAPVKRIIVRVLSDGATGRAMVEMPGAVGSWVWVDMDVLFVPPQNTKQDCKRWLGQA